MYRHLNYFDRNSVTELDVLIFKLQLECWSCTFTGGDIIDENVEYIKLGDGNFVFF